MSTESADIERMARDIYAKGSPDDHWFTAPDTRRKFCMGMAKHLHSLGYKPSIVHECCVTAQHFKEAIVEEAEILSYGVVSNAGHILAHDWPADDIHREIAIDSAAQATAQAKRVGNTDSFQAVMLVAIPTGQTNG